MRQTQSEVDRQYQEFLIRQMNNISDPAGASIIANNILCKALIHLGWHKLVVARNQLAIRMMEM